MPATLAAATVATLLAAPVTAAQATTVRSSAVTGITTRPASRAAANRNIAAVLVRQRGWNKAQYQCLSKLWRKESGWNHRAANRNSGAYGIPQALPGSKMASAGADWRTNPATQIKWGLGYISSRYGTPCKAWSHSRSHGWY